MLPVLATVEDLADLGYDPVSEGMLVRASSRVRGYTGQEITPGESTIELTGTGPWLLPQRPVDEVVSVVDRDDEPVAYELRGQYLHTHVCAPLTVTYRHGFDPVPDGLIEVVCAIAARLGGMPGSVGSGVRTEQAGGESVTWGAEAFHSASGLTRGEQRALDRFFPRLPRTVRLL